MTLGDGTSVKVGTYPTLPAAVDDTKHCKLQCLIFWTVSKFSTDFWDTAGQERFNSLHPSYYYKADVCILVRALLIKLTLLLTTKV